MYYVEIYTDNSWQKVEEVFSPTDAKRIAEDYRLERGLAARVTRCW